MDQIEINTDAPHTVLLEIGPNTDLIKAQNRDYLERFLNALEKEPDLAERFRKILEGGSEETAKG